MKLSRILIGVWLHSWIYDEMYCTSPVGRRVRRIFGDDVLIFAFVSLPFDGNKQHEPRWMNRTISVVLCCQWLHGASRKHQCPCANNSISLSLYIFFYWTDFGRYFFDIYQNFMEKALGRVSYLHLIRLNWGGLLVSGSNLAFGSKGGEEGSGLSWTNVTFIILFQLFQFYNFVFVKSPPSIGRLIGLFKIFLKIRETDE